jgi:hypothetical protein
MLHGYATSPWVVPNLFSKYHPQKNEQLSTLLGGSFRIHSEFHPVSDSPETDPIGAKIAPGFNFARTPDPRATCPLIFSHAR